ncbi:MAG: amidohydrolase, partial [Acidobacteria bacterium]|nr:amidohydrolase [Acidobacteriota bacterium]
MKSTRILPAIALLTLALAATRTAQAQIIAIKGGKVLTVTRGTLERGTVLIRDGKIEAVGADVQIPRDVRVIDARGLWVYPGFIDSQSQLGLVEIGQVEATRDLIEPSD